MKSFEYARMVGLGVLSIGLGSPAWAQSEVNTDAASNESEASGNLEEVLVTARRREERNQDVPISITALSGLQLEQRGVDSINELTAVAPGVKIEPQNNKPSTPQITIRGQRMYGILSAQDMPTAFYFADALVLPIQGFNSALYDVASVQVLKGPQGTLFGRNTTGGAVVVAPARPTDIFEGEVRATTGNYDSYGGQGFINVPVGDKLLLRAAAYYNEHGSYQNYISPETRGEDAWDDQTFDVRLSAIWRPTDTLENYLVAYYSKNSNSIITPVVVALNPNSPAGLFDGVTPPFDVYPGIVDQIWRGDRDPHDIYSDYPQFDETRVIGGVNTTMFDLGSVTLKNILSYRNVENSSLMNTMGTSAPFNASFQDAHTDVISEEFQVLGTAFDARMDWVAGLYYMRQDATDEQSAAIVRAPANPANVIPFLTDVLNESYAAYAQGTVRILEKLALTAGFRHTTDDRRIVYRHQTFDRWDVVGIPFVARCAVRDANNMLLPLDQCRVPQSTSFKEPTWTVSLDYHVTPDTLLYLTHRRGYRSGGYNQRAFTAPQRAPFHPETVMDYEVGIKTDFRINDWSLRLNADYYHDTYDDLQKQINQFIPGIGVTNSVFNAASGSVQGVEVDFTVQPVSDLTMNVGYAYTETEYDSYDFLVNGVVQDFSDREFSGIPRHQFTAFVNYRLPLDASVGDVSLSLNYTYQDSSYISDVYQSKEDLAVLYTPAQLARIPDDTVFEQDSYDLVNVRADWAGIFGRPVDLSVYARNLFDEDAQTFNNPSYEGLGVASIGFGPPRTYGIELTYRFGE